MSLRSMWSCKWIVLASQMRRTGNRPGVKIRSEILTAYGLQKGYCRLPCPLVLGADICKEQAGPFANQLLNKCAVLASRLGSSVQ